MRGMILKTVTVCVCIYVLGVVVQTITHPSSKCVCVLMIGGNDCTGYNAPALRKVCVCVWWGWLYMLLRTPSSKSVFVSICVGDDCTDYIAPPLRTVCLCLCVGDDCTGYSLYNHAIYRTPYSKSVCVCVCVCVRTLILLTSSSKSVCMCMCVRGMIVQASTQPLFEKCVYVYVSGNDCTG